MNAVGEAHALGVFGSLNEFYAGMPGTLLSCFLTASASCCSRCLAAGRGVVQSFGRRHAQRIRRVRSVFTFRDLCLFFCTRLSALHCEDVPRLQVIKIYALVPSLSLLPGHTLQLVFLA